MAKYKVTLVTGNGDVTIDVADDEIILDIAEEQGLDLPYSCRAGACTDCVGRVVKGSVDQSSQTFLEKEQVDKGYILTCVACPTSDVTIETGKKSDIEV